MMKNLLKILIVQLTLSNAFGANISCKDKKNLIQDNKKVSLCYEEKKQFYLSPECESVESCFKVKNLDLTFRQDQSPGFSLCYQMGGDAFFGVIEGLDEKIPFCEYKGRFIDQENLILEWKSFK